MLARPVTFVVQEAVPLFREPGLAIQGAVSRIGILVELVSKPNWAEFFAAMKAGEADMFISAWNVRQLQPARVLRPLFDRRDSTNRGLTRYRSRRVDELLDQARQVADGPVRDGLYAEVRRRVIEDAPMVFLYHLRQPSAHSARVRGLILNWQGLPSDKLIDVDVAD